MARLFARFLGADARTLESVLPDRLGDSPLVILTTPLVSVAHPFDGDEVPALRYDWEQADLA